MQNKKILALEILIAIGLLAGLSFFLLRNTDQADKAIEPAPEQQVNQIDFSPSTEEDAAFVEGIKEEIIQEESSEAEANQTYVANITNASLSGDNLTVTTAINGQVNGACELNVSDDTSTITSNDSTIQANAQSGCVQTIDISALDQSAEWSIDVSVDLGDETITATSASRSEDR